MAAPGKFRAESLRQALETNLWVFPLAAVFAAFGLARLLLWIDRHLLTGESSWTFVGGEPQSARELLSTIASSLLSITGVVFSITILVLQLASSQYSSRVMRTFLEDRATKLSMATFVGTFVFAMMLLPEVRDGVKGGDPFVPAVSLVTAFAFALLSLGVLIRYVHHMAHSIRAITVIRRVGEETRQSLDGWCAGPVCEPTPTPELPRGPPARELAHELRGLVLTALDDARLFELAEQHDAVIALVPEVGAFVPQGGLLFRCWGARLPPDEQLREALVFGEERTVHQDPGFGFRQLVDVAERALSPGVNDPSTAVQAIDQLHDLLRLLATRELPPVARANADGRPRLVVPRHDWTAFVRLALDEVRHFGEGSIQVARRLQAVLDDLTAVAPPHRRAVLREQQQLLDQSVARGFPFRLERAVAAQPSTEGHGSTSP